MLLAVRTAQLMVSKQQLHWGWPIWLQRCQTESSPKTTWPRWFAVTGRDLEDASCTFLFLSVYSSSG